MFVIDGSGIGTCTPAVMQRLLEERVVRLFAGCCGRRITESVMSVRHCQENSHNCRRNAETTGRSASCDVPHCCHYPTFCLHETHLIKSCCFLPSLWDDGICPVRILRSCFLRFVLILSFHSICFSTKLLSVCVCQLLHACYTPHPFHSPTSGHYKLFLKFVLLWLTEIWASKWPVAVTAKQMQSVSG